MDKHGQIILDLAIAVNIQFKDNAVMNKPVDSRSSRHWVFKYLFPLRKWKIAGDHQAALLIPVCQEGEQHLHLFPALLYIPDIINDHCIKPG